ncbi:MAG: hypothetical protein JRH15_03970 [Deltaproteobacteria bacterium]|nr:hypothetical protein [Deltaproteobacteria bacterium]
MDIKTEVMKLIKSAELYQGQGLYKDAKEAYQAAADLIGDANQLKKQAQLLSLIENKIDELGETEERIDSAPPTHELPPDVQNLIKDLFAFPNKKDPDVELLYGAVTLAKFGQIDRAISDLTELLKNRKVRVAAAKNIIRCHLLMQVPDKAVSAYRKWSNDEMFSLVQMENIHGFLVNQLKRRGIEAELPILNMPAPIQVVTEPEAAPSEAVDVVDIGSVVINFDQGPLQGKPMELDVNFQTGNTVSLLIESKDKDILDHLNVGFRLREIQYRSSIAIFRGGGVVSAKVKIHEGPKQGDYHLDIKLQDS